MYQNVGVITGRIQLASEELNTTTYSDRPLVSSPEEAADVLGPLIHDADRECAVVAHLDTKHRVLGVELVSVGSIGNTFIAPREVFRSALLANARSIVLGHNHPSGDITPSDDDELLTGRLVKSGELLGIDVLDHLIFGSGTWTSLARRGVL